jgi:dTDP-4-amino-4,6-dideoxygalactose transaminase
MDEIVAIAREHGLFVVEDAAQAFGGLWKGRKLGTIGDAGAFSFFPSKNLGGFGDGGMVATGDGETARLVRMLLKHGGEDKYNADHIGYNARLDTLQAAVLLAKLPYIDDLNARRGRLACLYHEALADLDGLVLPPEGGDHAYHQFTIRVAGGRRDALQRHLRSCLVGSAVYTPSRCTK